MTWGSAAFRGGALTNSDKGQQSARPLPVRSASNIVVTDERAMMISAVFACVRLLVQTGATLPLGFFERTTEGRELLDPEHYLCQLLKFSPNNFMTAKEFRQAMWTQRVLWGNGYAKIKWMGERPVSLTPLKPEFMTVNRGESGLIYKYSTDSGIKEYSQREMFHLKGFSTDGIVGISALGYARESLGVSVAAEQTAAKSIGGRANAVLETDDVPTAEQKAQLRELYGSGQMTSEYHTDGGLMITPAGLKYRAISMPPDDLQLLESRQFQIPEICRFFGVPAVMVDGAAGAAAAWPASYEQQVLSFLTFGLKPYLDEWEDAIPDSLLSPKDRRTIFAEHNVEGLLRADSKARSDFYASAAQNGWMTRAEIRRRENLTPREGSDELTVQVNLTPLDELDKVGDTNATE